ncbi:unnamed protein product [Prunus armeniaca]|uniref:Uncharacterized protein n=1 Tax=Prunus armeniaca TaxID=36596 RepID=A0A6J5W0S1_PRUAR|nr:unnamed protein product [Prunus armeniaca]
MENTNGLPSKFGVWRPTGLLLQLEKVIGLSTFSVPSTEISSTSKPVTFKKAFGGLAEFVTYYLEPAIKVAASFNSKRIWDLSD